MIISFNLLTGRDSRKTPAPQNQSKLYQIARITNWLPALVCVINCTRDWIGGNQLSRNLFTCLDIQSIVDNNYPSRPSAWPNAVAGLIVSGHTGKLVAWLICAYLNLHASPRIHGFIQITGLILKFSSVLMPADRWTLAVLPDFRYKLAVWMSRCQNMICPQIWRITRLEDFYRWGEDCAKYLGIWFFLKQNYCVLSIRKPSLVPP